MKATENQHVRASYPSTQATAPVGTITSAAPATRRTRAVPEQPAAAIRGPGHFANDVELLSPIDEHVGEGRERGDEEVDAEVPGAERIGQPLR